MIIPRAKAYNADRFNVISTAGYRDMSGTFGVWVAGDRGEICAQATIPGVVN